MQVSSLKKSRLFPWKLFSGKIFKTIPLSILKDRTYNPFKHVSITPFLSGVSSQTFNNSCPLNSHSVKNTTHLSGLGT
jgi:hypothetical protein